MTEELDAERILAELRRGAEDAALIAARRPAPSDVAELLRLSIRALHYRSEVCRLEGWRARGADPHQTAQWYAMPDSPAALEQVAHEVEIENFVAGHSPAASLWWATNPERNSIAWAVEALHRYFKTIVDALLGVAHVHAEGLVRAPLILGRTALESAATLCRISDLECGKEERLRRILNLRLSGLKEVQFNASPESQTPDVDELYAFGRQLGYSSSSYKKGRFPAPALLPKDSRGIDSVRTMLTRVLPQDLGRYAWHSLSAVTHASDGMLLLADEFTASHEVDRNTQARSTAWHLLPVLCLLPEVCSRIDRYMGWDLSDQADSLDQLCAVWSVAAGLSDDLIRQHLGLADPASG